MVVQGGAAMLVISPHETGAFGQVHPGQQVGVIGAVGLAVGIDPIHLAVDALDPFHGLFGHVTPAKGGGRDEKSGAAQTCAQVVAKAGMVPDTRQGAGVQGLNDQRSDATHHHGHEMCMHLPGAAVGPQQARVASGLQKHLGPLPGVGHVPHLLCDALFDGVHGEGWRDRVLDAPIKALGR